MSEKEIRSFRGEHAFLSNFYTAPFAWDGRSYLNAEAAFQSAKCLAPEERDAFSQLDGVKAKHLGKHVPLRSDWEQVKTIIMEEVVRAKFTQNPDLARQLLDTGDAHICEGNSWGDTFWGVNTKTNKGENHLGKILMQVREEIRCGNCIEEIRRMHEERKAAAARKICEMRNELAQAQQQLSALPVYDFTGMAMTARVFGRVTVARQESNYLFVHVMGKERCFALPGCILDGFLVPDDSRIVENLHKHAALKARIAALRTLLDSPK